jgi:hypothetical protein
VRIFIAIEKSAKGHSSLSPGKTPHNQWGQNHLEVSFELFRISESEFEMKLSILDEMKNSKNLLEESSIAIKNSFQNS